MDNKMSTIISLHKEYVDMILNDQKNIEFRRGKLYIPQGSPLYVYCTGERRFKIAANVKRVCFGSSGTIWNTIGNLPGFCPLPGITKEKYFEYAPRTTLVTAIYLEEIKQFTGPTLHEMRDHFPGWRPPQRVIYLDKKSRGIFDFLETQLQCN